MVTRCRFILEADKVQVSVFKRFEEREGVGFDFDVRKQENTNSSTFARGSQAMVEEVGVAFDVSNLL